MRSSVSFPGTKLLLSIRFVLIKNVITWTNAIPQLKSIQRRNNELFIWGFHFKVL